MADAWAVPHADADDYFWWPTDPPYTAMRPPADRVALMQQVFIPRKAWVLSGSMLGWGQSVVERCDAVVFLSLDSTERLARLELRERVRRGQRPVDEGALETFLAWARKYDDPSFDGRSRRAHEEWLATLTCPVLRLDSASPRDKMCDAVLTWAPPPVMALEEAPP